eukprot:Em0009g312a
MFQCPICERNSSIPLGGASVLPQNLHLAFEVEVAGYMSKMFLCKVAYEYHRTGRHHSKHNMVGLDQEGARQLHTIMKPRDPYCSQPNHENNELIAYSTHKSHTMKEISTVAKNHQMEITGARENAKETHTDYEIVALGGLIATELQAILKRVQTTALIPNQHSNITVSVQTDDFYTSIVDIRKLNTIGSNGIGDGQFTYPSGIAIKGDVLYVADLANHWVLKMTSSGKFLHRLVRRDQVADSSFRHLVSSLTPLTKLIVADKDNHRIQIFNESGGWLLTIDGKGSGNHSFESPQGLALDSQGNIHVAAQGSNIINVFTKEGVYVRMYGGDPKGPSGITIDDEGYSLVSVRDGNCLSIYDPEGNKIHTVGNLKNPYGTAVDPRDGSCVRC